MERQNTNTILMIEPVSFGFNAETALNNYFQQNDGKSPNEIQALAHAEFLNMVQLLQANSVRVIVVKDTDETHTPDSIFPNNWLSFHGNKGIAVYPMFAQNRRLERRVEVLQAVIDAGFNFSEIEDYTKYEHENRFMEGTGSMILDREKKIAYAALSERTDKGIFLQFCADFDYKAVCFTANQTVENKRLAIYHSNVMMSVADKYVIICLDSIDDINERNDVVENIQKSDKELIEITEAEMQHFAGNMLQLRKEDGQPILVMSQSAYDFISEDLRAKLLLYNEILAIPVPTIEQYGGGSVRCMMAEVF